MAQIWQSEGGASTQPEVEAVAIHINSSAA